MTETLKIAIPMAGLGTRMRPHTWSKPKPLIALAGRTVLDYVLEQFKTLPEAFDVEYIFIIGPQGDQLKKHMEKHHPEKKVHYVLQAEMRGQSDALWQAREHLTGKMLMAFSDTLIETDLSFLQNETADGIACVKEVEDPRRFGVAIPNADGYITRLIEKPQDLSHNLVVVGFYYFKSAETLISAIQEQINRNVRLKDEYFLADAINILLEQGEKFRTRRIDTWLDAGTPESLLETNRYLLENGYDNTRLCNGGSGCAIVPPVYVHESARIENSVIGPYVSIGKDCHVIDAIVRNSVIEESCTIERMILEDSLLGQDVHLKGQPSRFNIGNNAWITR
ncbi:MAG TPA: sugar phosphate nucleotidyltransferase [Levilinea sp.]|nr:sugar phosphate nucleotidyltransferase [Levilinea sp.]